MTAHLPSQSAFSTLRQVWTQTQRTQPTVGYVFLHQLMEQGQSPRHAHWESLSESLLQGNLDWVKLTMKTDHQNMTTPIV